MILSEKEAETKLCQETLALDTLRFCRASSCMAWRWFSRDIVQVLADDGRSAAMVQRHHAIERLLKIERDVPDLGYCGKGGDPAVIR